MSHKAFLFALLQLEGRKAWDHR